MLVIFEIFGSSTWGVVVDIMGGFWTYMFGTALANAQADSMTGAVAIIAFTGIYMLVCLSIVNLSFNAIHLIPDEVLGWAGGQLQATLGRGMEDHVNSKVGSSISAVGSQTDMAGGSAIRLARKEGRLKMPKTPSGNGSQNTQI